MPQYVATITDILDQQDEPVVLVAHSRGGLQITQAAEERPNKIRKLVYLASVLLPNGVSLADVIAQRPDLDSKMKFTYDAAGET